MKKLTLITILLFSTQANAGSNIPYHPYQFDNPFKGTWKIVSIQEKSCLKNGQCPTNKKAPGKLSGYDVKIQGTLKFKGNKYVLDHWFQLSRRGKHSFTLNVDKKGKFNFTVKNKKVKLILHEKLASNQVYEVIHKGKTLILRTEKKDICTFSPTMKCTNIKIETYRR